MNYKDFFDLVVHKIKDDGYNIRLTRHGAPYFAGVSYPKFNTMFINLGYKRPRRISLIALHEYGHLVLQTDCKCYQNFKLRDEHAANIIAVNTIVQIYWDQWPCDCDEADYFTHMIECLDVPSFLFQLTANAFKRLLIA